MRAVSSQHAPRQIGRDASRSDGRLGRVDVDVIEHAVVEAGDRQTKQRRFNYHLRWHVEASFQISKKSHELLLVSQALLWPFLLGFGLDGRLLLARRGRVYV